MKDWDKVTEKELRDMHETMTDRQIADVFQITIGKVRYKRNKYGINFKNHLYKDFMDQSSQLFQDINRDSRNRVLGKDLDTLAKALTHYLFRNGPVEDMHANGQLSQSDMQELNTFMVNKMAGLIYKIRNEDWLQIELLLEYLTYYGTEWDEAIPDTNDFDQSWKNYQERIKEMLLGSSPPDLNNV